MRGPPESPLPRNKVPAVAVAATFTVICLCMAAIAWGPHLARDYIASWAGAWIGRQVTIGGISINPFLARIRVTDFVVTGAATNQPLLAVPRAMARLDLSAAIRGRIELAQVVVSSPTMRFARTAPNEFSFQDILSRHGGETDEAARTWPVLVEDAEIKGGKVIVRDEVAETVLEAVRLQVRLTSISNEAEGDRPVRGEASFEFEDARVDISFGGSPMAKPPVLDAKIRVADFPASNLAPYLPLTREARVEGRLHAAAEASYGAGGWSLAEGSVQLADGTLTLGPRQVAVVESLTLDGIRVDPAGKDAAASSFRVDGGQLKVIRDEHGRLPFTQLLAGTEPVSLRGSAAVTTARGPDMAQSGWRYALDAADIEQMKVQYIDRRIAPERRLPDTALDLHAENISNEAGRAVAFHASLTMVDESQASFRGSVRALPFELRGRVEANAVAISPFEPYLDLLPNLSLVSGELWGKGDVEITSTKEMTGVHYRGDLSLNDVRVVDNVVETDFLRWSALVASDVSAAWHPGLVGQTGIEIADVVLLDFFGKAVLDEKGRLNLSYLLDRQSSKPTSNPSDPAAASETRGSTDDDVQVDIRTLRVASGHVNLTDNFVEPNYTVDLTQLSGSITGVSSRSERPAEVSITGRVNGEAPLAIAGSIDLLAPQPALDLRASASGIELTELSPYTVRWAGFEVQGGTLSAQVHYRVEGGRLEGDNRFVLHRLNLGDKVPGAGTSDLPLGLALSLLRDRDGNVTLNLPISGSLEDPEFSFSGLISRAVTGFFRKLVTAPFSFLAALAGSTTSGAAAEAAADGRLNYVEFPPGKATLGPGQHDRITSLAEALHQRPAVGLQVTGYAGLTVDRQGLRESRLETSLRSARNTEDRRGRLTALYKEQVGSEVSVEGLTTRDLEKLLLDQVEISEADLLVLARRRGVTALEALVDAGVHRDRLRLLSPEFAAEDTGLPSSRAQFNVMESALH